MTALEIVQEVRENWYNLETLSICQLNVIERQLELGTKLAQIENAINNAFVAEKEDGYKMTDSVARAKAKAMVDTGHTEFDHEYTTLSNLIDILILRISGLHQEECELRARSFS